MWFRPRRVAGILREHEAAQAIAARSTVAESALDGCVLTLDGDRPVLRTPVGAIALVGGRGPADQPRVRLFRPMAGRPASLPC